MLRFVPILALALAVCVPPPGSGTALAAQTAQQRDPGVSPRTLERRAKNAAPERKAALLRLAAQRWLERGARKRALLALDRAIEAQPNDPRGWQRRAELHAAAGANQAAFNDVERAIELDATRASAYRLRATLWRRIGASDLAAADLARATVARQQSAKGGAQLLNTPADATESASATLAALARPRTLAPGRTTTSNQNKANNIAAGALDALTLSAAVTIAAPRSLLPSAEALAASGALGDESALAAQPARPAILEHPALDGITMAATHLRANPGAAPIHVASNQPLFPPPEQRAGQPAAPDPIEAHRRRMEAAAIVQRRIEAGEAMMAAMRAAPAGGLVDPNFRASTAPLPKIFRGTQIPPQLAATTGIARATPPNADVGGPYLPVRKAAAPQRQAKSAAAPVPASMVAALPRALGPLPTAPASFDATPTDPMVEQSVAAPVIAVERGPLR